MKASAPDIKRILVVDDELQMHRCLKPMLEASGYTVSQAATALEGLRVAAERAPAAMLLDLGLPDLDGQEVIRRVRAFSDMPIIVISGRDREAEKIQALDQGADDFVEKPFASGELLARLRVCLRRTEARNNLPGSWRGHGVEVDFMHRRVSVDGAEVAFTPREYDLLSVLARNAGLVLTQRQLLTAVWGSGHAGDVQYLRVYIGLLRQKLGPAGTSLIMTIFGTGYRLASSESPLDREGKMRAASAPIFLQPMAGCYEMGPR